MQTLRASVIHLVVAAFALSGAALPQSPSTAVNLSAPPRRGLTYDEGTPGGGVWVRGENFKAHFACDGATFVPFFGSSAPRNFDVHLALQSVTVDGAPIGLA